LQLLRGETAANDDDMKAVIKLFEYVYPSGEFSMSKTALMCIGSTLNSFSFCNNTANQYHSSTVSATPRPAAAIVLPRWVAHALFPEYSVSIAFQSGESDAGRFAATLGWCEHGEGERCIMVTPLESVVLAALPGSGVKISDVSADIGAKTGTQPCPQHPQFLHLISAACICLRIHLILSPQVYPSPSSTSACSACHSKACSPIAATHPPPEPP
jgi:hypothetical protein